MLWIKTEQTKFLSVELAYLTNGKGSGPSLVSQLDLFLDRERVVRCSGRLRCSHLSKETKHPIFIPRQSLLTPLIIRAYHERNFHSGPGNTVNNIRQCYWINCALSVKLALRGCTFWRREDGSPYIAPDHAALPDFRVTPSFPFTATGIEYTSACIVRTDNGDIKVYISLFTCAASRAIHLEVLTDLSAKEFIQVFRRFTSHHSLPKLVMTDNATNLTAGNKIVQRLLNNKEVQAYSSNLQIEWRTFVWWLLAADGGPRQVQLEKNAWLVKTNV